MGQYSTTVKKRQLDLGPEHDHVDAKVSDNETRKKMEKV